MIRTFDKADTLCRASVNASGVLSLSTTETIQPVRFQSFPRTAVVLRQMLGTLTDSEISGLLGAMQHALSLESQALLFVALTAWPR